LNQHLINRYFKFAMIRPADGDESDDMCVINIPLTRVVVQTIIHLYRGERSCEPQFIHFV